MSVSKVVFAYVVMQLVQEGVPFRDAYKIVGAKVGKGEFHPKKKVSHSHIGSIGNLGLDRIRQKMIKANAHFK